MKNDVNRFAEQLMQSIKADLMCRAKCNKETYSKEEILWIIHENIEETLLTYDHIGDTFKFEFKFESDDMEDNDCDDEMDDEDDEMDDEMNDDSDWDDEETTGPDWVKIANEFRNIAESISESLNK